MSNTDKRDEAEIIEKMKLEDVSIEEKKSALQTAIYEITKTSPFFGSTLQVMDIYYAHTIPTAGVMFNGDAKKFEMVINPFFFCKRLNAEQRRAVLLHEIFHVTHKHTMRAPFMKIKESRRQMMNIAMDMAINQYIKGLPKGCNQCPPQESGQQCKNPLCPGSCIDVADFNDEAKGQKVPWERNKSFEYYYEKLIRRYDDDPNGDGEGDGEGGGGQGDGSGKGKGKKKCPGEFDSHHWENNGEESDMMDAAEDLVKRAMQKRGLDYSELPGHVKDMLEEIAQRRTELNYRGLILAAIKRHASGHDRKHTWTRKSRRWGHLAPGTKIADLPKLHLFLDSSGSISTEELNEFLGIVDQFLKVGSRKCTVTLFHTSAYHTQPYKLGERFDKNKVESGGTDLTECFEIIAKTRPDMAIFCTDGCYGDVNFESMVPPNTPFPQCLFVISKHGDENHPLKRTGETVKVPMSDNMTKDGKIG